MKWNIRLRLFAGFILALILSILPLPSFICVFRPPWVLLLSLYIGYFLPGKSNLLALLVLGLILDVLLSSVLGEHSFALLVVTWLAANKSRRFQFFSMMQQIFLIGFFCLLYELIIALIDALLGFNYNIYHPLGSALMGMFFWPWIRLLGEDIFLTRRTYR
jgi:rod shape-determining protein MreD